MMRCNVGGVDRGVRLCIATLLLLSAFLVTTSSGWATALVVIATLPLFSGLTGFCPISWLLGVNSCEIPRELE